VADFILHILRINGINLFFILFKNYAYRYLLWDTWVGVSTNWGFREKREELFHRYTCFICLLSLIPIKVAVKKINSQFHLFFLLSKNYFWMSYSFNVILFTTKVHHCSYDLNFWSFEMVQMFAFLLFFLLFPCLFLILSKKMPISCLTCNLLCASLVFLSLWINNKKKM